MPTLKGGYTLADGTKVPSVTTIISRFKESGALLYWAFNQGKSGTATLYEERDKAADVGTTVHALIEQTMRDPFAVNMIDLANRMLPDEGQRQKALAAFEAYVRWSENMRIRVVAQEKPLVSEAHKFGGTLDFIGVTDNRLALFDIKTSGAIYTDYLIQVAAYGRLWEENHPDQPITGGYHILRFSKENGDFGHSFFPDLTEAWHQFLLFREAYDIDKLLKKRVG